MKKVLLIGLAVLVTISLFSATKIRFSFWGSPAEVPPYQEIVNAFMKKNPEIQIEIINYPWSTYFDKIQAMMAAEDAPDVMFLHTIPSWASKGVLEDLTPYIEKSKFPVESYNQELLSTFTYRGRIYGFPRDNDTTVLFYNKSLFDEAGVPYPDYSWDWQKFLEAARKLTKVDARGRVTQWGVVLERNKWHLWIHMNGGRIVDNYDAPKKCTLNERAAVEAIQFIADMILHYKVTPSIAELTQLGSAAELFTTGRVAMVLSNAAQIGSFMTNKNLKFGVAPLPYQVTRTNTLGGAGFVMYAKSKNKEAAWKFMEFLCGPEGQSIFAKSGDAVPAMRTPETVKAFISNPPSEQERLIFFTETGFGVKFPQIPNWWEIFEYVTRELDYVWTGQKSVVEVLEYVSNEVTKMIQQGGRW